MQIIQNSELERHATEYSLGPRDVANCFNLFLGRMPTNARGDGDDSGSIPELLREIFETQEFKTGVLQPLLLREELPHGKSDGAALFPMIDWVQHRLPVGTSTRRTAGATRTWAQLLELLLGDESLVTIAPYLIEAEIDGVLRARLENEGWAKAERSVIGAVDSVSGFEVSGWAVDLCDKSLPVVIEFYADNLFIGSVTCNEPRPDVLDHVGGDGNYGFTFKISAAHRTTFSRGRTLVAVDSISHVPIGSSAVVSSDAAQPFDVIGATRKELSELRQALERIELRLADVSRVASMPVDAYDEYWHRFYVLTPEVLSDQRIQSRQLTYRPLISVVLPTWNSNTRLLDSAIRSVCTQTYEQWELVITDDASGNDELKELRRRYVAEERIRWLDADERVGIAANTNRGIVAARGEYIAFMDHDDELAPDALYHVAASLQDHRYGLLYSDEDRIEESESGRSLHHTPFFKPDFDPDLLMALNYICHLVVLRHDVIASVGGLRTGFEGAQDHDLLLRVAAHLPLNDILHLPRVLYHWRVTPGSVSRTPATADEIQKNIVAAVADHLEHRKLAARVEPHSDPVGQARNFATRVRWSLPPAAPKISIIIPTRDRVDLLRTCLDSVLDTVLLYPGLCEILLVDNDSVDPTTLRYFESLGDIPRIRLVRFRGAFNWSAINNVAAYEAEGEVLIFLNNDTVVLTPDWLVELVSNALRPDVGAVGARLLYGDGTIQHAGVVLGVEGVAGHECVGELPVDGGYFGRSQVLRSAAAVTGACLATRRSLFQQSEGGFEDLNLKIAFNDVDYCMRVRKAGYRVVYNPFAVLYHLESKSRGRDISESQRIRHRGEAAFFRERWGDREIADPYYNLHFERFARPFERLRPPPNLDSDSASDVFKSNAKSLPQ